MKKWICAALAVLLSLLPAAASAAFKLPKGMPAMTFQGELPKCPFQAVVIAREAEMRDASGKDKIGTLALGTVVTVHSCTRKTADVEFDGVSGTVGAENLMSLVAVAAVVRRDTVVTDCKWPRGDVHTGNLVGYHVPEGTVVYAAGLHGEGMIVVNAKGTAVGYISPRDIMRVPVADADAV